MHAKPPSQMMFCVMSRTSTSLQFCMQAHGEGVVLDQFGNADNPLGHYSATGPELWEQTHGRITHFVASMGTTGVPSSQDPDRPVVSACRRTV